MHRKAILFLSIFLFAGTVLAQDTHKLTSSFNQLWLKALVSIEVVDKGTAKSIGTGFLVGTPNNHIALVTAKHVVFVENGNGALRHNLAYRMNDKKGASILVPDSLVTRHLNSGWFRSDGRDLACRLIVRRESSDLLSIPQSSFLPIAQVQAGAPLFILGFPLGIRSEEYAMPIIRRAIVARADSSDIILDGFVFPGNSGDPVVYEPTVRFGKNIKTNILQDDWLVGMVLSYIPYIEPAYSLHTSRPRVIFEENSGLCKALPADASLELLQDPDFLKVDAALE